MDFFLLDFNFSTSPKWPNHPWFVHPRVDPVQLALADERLLVQCHIDLFSSVDSRLVLLDARAQALRVIRSESGSRILIGERNVIGPFVHIDNARMEWCMDIPDENLWQCQGTVARVNPWQPFPYPKHWAFSAWRNRVYTVYTNDGDNKDHMGVADRPDVGHTRIAWPLVDKQPRIQTITTHPLGSVLILRDTQLQLHEHDGELLLDVKLPFASSQAVFLRSGLLCVTNDQDYHFVFYEFEV